MADVNYQYNRWNDLSSASSSSEEDDNASTPPLLGPTVKNYSPATSLINTSSTSKLKSGMNRDVQQVGDLDSFLDVSIDGSANDEINTTASDKNTTGSNLTPRFQQNPQDTSGSTTASSQSLAMIVTSTQPFYANAYLDKPAERMWSEKHIQEMQENRSLLKAVKRGSIEGVRKLLERKVNINRPDVDGLTALHYAASYNHMHLVMMLIENGADKCARSKDGYTPLMLAAKKQRGDVAAILASYELPAKNPAVTLNSTTANLRGVDHTIFQTQAQKIADMPEPERVEALKQAVKKNDVAIAAQLIANGNSSLDEQDEDGNTLLVLAAKVDSVEMIRLLLCAGAKVDTVDRNAATPLMHAASTRHLPSIAIFLRAGARATHTDNLGRSAISNAICADDPAVLSALLANVGRNMQDPIDIKAFLIIAAELQNQASTQLLLNLGADVRDRHGSLSLAAMARQGNVPAFSTLLKAGADPGDKASDGHTAFTLAAANGQGDIVKLLLDHRHGQPDAVERRQGLQKETDSLGRTALMLAVLNKKYDMVEQLLVQGADLHKQDHEGRNAILWAAAKGNAEIVQLLMENRATHVCADKQGNTVWLAAAKNGNTKNIKIFCRPLYKNSEFHIDSTNRNGDTPLIVASEHGHLETVQALLENGAYLRHTNNLGRSALHAAIAAGHTQVYDLLMKKLSSLPMEYPTLDNFYKAVVQVFPMARALVPAMQQPQFEHLDKAGNSFIHLASSSGNPNIMDKLLEHGFPRRSSGDAGTFTMPLDVDEFALTSSTGGSIVMKSEGSDLEVVNKAGMTPLCVAIGKGMYLTAEGLIKRGANVNHVANHHETPLWLACRLTECTTEKHEKGPGRVLQLTPEYLVDMLLRHRALKDEPSFHEQTPLSAAAAKGNTQIVKRLIMAGVNVNHIDKDGLTPLMHASHSGNFKVVEMLLSAGALTNPSPRKLSALILAAEGGHDAVVRLLVEHGAQKNHVDEEGATALIGASRTGHPSTVALLIELGASLEIKDRFFRNAMYYAQNAQYGSENAQQYRIIELLKAGYPPPRDC